ncbi:TetR/AcrR family transcriptional regulator [Actinocorallia populi]|uniref:TetR/AcrR family transcriptional regulator n=1 Tax=Actinocorallia populi TaxID=2079200 RepID=UPI000D092D13|nr:TetR/AcrR family transcriptional regulator [Actinocorallia populi]
MDERAADVDERVLETAIRLFAELGYDATSLDMIAGAVGSDVSRSALLKDGKPGLYRAAFEHFYELDRQRFEAAAQGISHGVEGLHLLADTFLDFSLAHPEIGALWGHRVLKDAIDFDFPERFTPPLEVMMTSRTWEGVHPDTDLQFLAWTVIWMVLGFTHTGLPHEDGRRRYADDPSALHRFRTQLHRTIDARVRAPDAGR